MAKKLRLPLILALVTVLGFGVLSAGSAAENDDEILIGKDKVPEEIAEWAERLSKSEEGIIKESFEDWDAYLIAMGERPTGGYTVVLEQAGFSGGEKWIIDVRFVSPGPEDIVIMVITYPYEVIAVPAGVPVEIRVLEDVKEDLDPQPLPIESVSLPLTF